MKPLVSILIPAFNAQALIPATLASALAQTWPRIEVIVVDDGSTDGTAGVARRFDPARVTVISQPNRGAAAARNNALSVSRGDYIQWLDADDILSSDKIALQMEALGGAGPRTLLSSPWGHFLYRTRKARFRRTPLWEDLAPSDWMMRKMEHDAHMQPATWLVSRELSEAAGPWDTRLLGDDDGEYFSRVIALADGVKFVDNAKTYYRITGGGSLSSIGQSSRKIEAQFLACRLAIEHLLRIENTPRSRRACVIYLQKYVPLFYGSRPDLLDESQRIARSLGGSLAPPSLPPKYDWIRHLLGWRAAVSARHRYNAGKWAIARGWDKALFDLETAIGA